MRTHSRSGLQRGELTVILALAIIAGLLPAGATWARGPTQGLESVYAYRPPYVFRENVGLMDLAVTNMGFVGDPFLTTCNLCWGGNEYLYMAALWIGAIASDNLPYVSTGAYDTELRPSQDPVDTIYPNYEGCPHGNRPGFSVNPDDDNDGKTDEDFANGKDDDGDGKTDEDFAGISQQMLTCEYWDYTPEAIANYPQHRPLHVKVRQAVYGWSTEGANNFIGFDYTVLNEGFELLRNVYIGFFVDSDVGPKNVDGYWLDDGGAYYENADTVIVDPSISYTCTDRGSFSNRQRDCSQQHLNLSICYMYDVPDNGTTAKGGDAPGYIGAMFLGHTTDPSGLIAPKKVGIHTARFFSGSAAYPAGDPANDTERYDLLQSGEKARRPTGEPGDYRYCISAGPFGEFRPGKTIQFQTAFVIGDGLQGMLGNAVNAQRIYNGKWRDVDNNPQTGKNGAELCLKAVDPTVPVVWVDHCDTSTYKTKTVKDTVCLAANYVDDDCNCCTPLFANATEAATEGLETLVHWVGSVAPPPPSTNSSSHNPNLQVVAPAGDRRVIISWDNTSELSADPISARILFTGYRIFRVEGWDRPVGSPGPAPGDWSQIAELSYKPADGLGAKSPFYLRKYRKDIDSLYSVNTGSTRPSEKIRWYYPVGRYVYSDTLGLKNGMIYFYGVTAYSAWDSTVVTVSSNGDTTRSVLHFELAGKPSAVESDGVVPVWKAAAAGNVSGVYVVPNPYIKGQNPAGWDLTPSSADPTGTKIAFVGLPEGKSNINIYTLSGDLVQTLEHDASSSNGTAFWNLVSRNGQDIVSGVYLFSVQSGGKTKVGRFVIVR